MAYRERVGRNLGERAHLHFDDGAPGQQLDLAAVLGQAGGQDQLYVCGPAGFIAAVLGKGGEAGWAEDRLHKEFFPAPEGEADHRDFLFSEEERAANTRMTVCCSRAKSARLVLDL